MTKGRVDAPRRPLTVCFVSQNSLFRAATGKALTIVRAGLALTTHILPKISFLPALVAGFFLVLILQRPGRVKTPDFFTSAVATSAMLAKALTTSFFFISHEVATASAKPPFVMTAPFIAFALGAICWAKLSLG